MGLTSRSSVYGVSLAILPLVLAAPLAIASALPTPGDNSLTAGGGGKCSYHYVDHGGAPVVVSATCKISEADLDKGCDTNPTTRDYARKLGGHDGVHDDDAGHILAHRLGGSGEEPTNIFPQALHDNRGDWREFEAEIYGCLSGANTLGVKATIEWTFQYESESKQRPTTMTYATSYEGGSCSDVKKKFSNK